MAAAQGLIYQDGNPIQARDIAAVRARASLSPDGSGYTPPWSYDGATPVSQDMSTWLPQIRSPDSEINDNRDRMVARARDLVRNDGWAQGAINRMLDAAIGRNFFPIPRPNWKALARKFGPKFDAVWAKEFQSAIHAEWTLFAMDPSHRCDATRQQTLVQMFATAARSKFVEGDGLLFIGWNQDAREAGASRYATTVMGIDPDRLSNPQDMIDTHDRRGGVQIDGIGGAVGYHIRRAHQYNYYDTLASITWDLYPKETPWGRPVIVHDYDKERWDQHRGLGVLHAVLGRFRMLNRFDQTSLQAAVIRAVLGFFITSSQDEGSVQDALDTDNDSNLAGALQTFTDRMKASPLAIGGARVGTLLPGEKVQTVTGGGHADDFDAFENAVLRSISSATGQAAVEISNDFSKLNYSSFRGAIQQAWRTLIRRREDFATGTATPVYGAWLEEALELFPELLPKGVPDDAFQQLRGAFCLAKWIGPGRGWIDPVKERQGEVLGLDAGFGTLEDTCADVEGEYWEDRLDQRQIEVNAMKARGLKPPQWAAATLPAEEVDAKPQPA